MWQWLIWLFGVSAAWVAVCPREGEGRGSPLWAGGVVCAAALPPIRRGPHLRTPSHPRVAADFGKVRAFEWLAQRTNHCTAKAGETITGYQVLVYHINLYPINVHVSQSLAIFPH